MDTTRLPGFTYIEVMTVLGIVAIMSTIVTVIGVSAMTRTQVAAQLDLLLADISFQQQQAANRVLSDKNTQDYGLHFAPTSYTVFSGQSYNPSDPTNQVVPLQTGMEFSTINVPEQQVVFSQGTGFLKEFVATQSGLIITSPEGSATTLTINRYGVVEIVR